MSAASPKGRLTEETSVAMSRIVVRMWTPSMSASSSGARVRPNFSMSGRGSRLVSMRLSLPSVLPAALLTALLVGCTPTDDTTEDVAAPAPTAEEAPVTDSGLPHDALPEVPGGRDSWEECPYLDTAWVSDTNGQRTLGVGVDARFDTPSCVFWSYPEEPHLTVIVRDMPDTDAAIRVVDWAAPIDTTEPAEEPEGWSGGRAGAGLVPDREGSLYAVQKDDRAVVVFTNQDQSLKAELVAKEVIATLGL